MLITILTHPEANSYVTIEEVEAIIKTTSWTSLTKAEKEQKIIDAVDVIDSFRFVDYPVVSTPRYYRDKQALAFPRDFCKKYTFTISNSTISTITTNNFLNNQSYFNNFCKDWALIVTDGTGKGQTLQILSYNNETGIITTTEDFTTQPDTTSQFIIIEKIPEKIKKATILQIKYMLSIDQSVLDAQAMGIKSRSIDDISETYTNAGGRLLSTEVENILKDYIDRTGSLC